MPLVTRSKKRKLLAFGGKSDSDDTVARTKKRAKGNIENQLDSIKSAERSTGKNDPSILHHIEKQQDVIDVVCGTSGYSYSHWNKGVYYPTGYSSKQWDFYSNEFNAVEINASFYRWQKQETWKSWYNRAEKVTSFIKSGGDSNKKRRPFVYAVKAHQYFTHFRQLLIDKTFVTKFKHFVDDCQILKQHLGPILFQFPSRFHCNDRNLARLDQFGKLVMDINNDVENRNNGSYDDSSHKSRRLLRVVLEFRHSSWYEQISDVYKVASKYHLCVCLIHLTNDNPKNWADGLPSGYSPSLETYPFDTLCDWGAYIRLHGTKGQYEGSYAHESLDRLLQTCKEKMANSRSLKYKRNLFIFFNNTDSNKPPAAIQDARYICDQQAK